MCTFIFFSLYKLHSFSGCYSDPLLKSVLLSCQSLNQKMYCPLPIYRVLQLHLEPYWTATGGREETPQVRLLNRRLFLVF